MSIMIRHCAHWKTIDILRQETSSCCSANVRPPSLAEVEEGWSQKKTSSRLSALVSLDISFSSGEQCSCTCGKKTAQSFFLWLRRELCKIGYSSTSDVSWGGHIWDWRPWAWKWWCRVRKKQADQTSVPSSSSLLDWSLLIWLHWFFYCPLWVQQCYTGAMLNR